MTSNRASSLADLHQCCRFRIVYVAGNRSVPDPLDRFIDHEQRYKKPFARDHRLSEAILDLDVRLDSHALALVGDEATAPEGVEQRTADLLHFVGQYRRYALAAYAEARPLYERALAMREKVLGAEHPVTASSLGNLANLLHDQGDLAGARPLHERALAIWEKVLGAEHPDTALSLNNLAVLLQDQGDLAGARPLYERALAIREKVLGAEHPHTATSLNNLALLLKAQGDLAAARP